MPTELNFLADLPSFEEQNFSRFQNDNNVKCVSKRSCVYIPTKDIPSRQVITPQKTNILLRYLHKHYNKKMGTGGQSWKRENSDSSESRPNQKRLRLDNMEDEESS